MKVAKMKRRKYDIDVGYIMIGISIVCTTILFVIFRIVVF